MGIVTADGVPLTAFAVMTLAVLLLVGVRDNLVSLLGFLLPIAVGIVIVVPVALDSDQGLATILAAVGGCVLGALIGAFLRSLTRDKND